MVSNAQRRMITKGDYELVCYVYLKIIICYSLEDANKHFSVVKFSNCVAQRYLNAFSHIFSNICNKLVHVAAMCHICVQGLL